MFTDKYNMSKEESIFLAKRTIVENVYHSSKLEGCNITFPDTQTIINGVSVGGLDMHEVNIIVNLKRAWEYVIKNIDRPFDLEFAKGIHNFVGYNEALKWGEFRDGEVGITGVDYKPPIPDQEEISHEASELLTIPNVTKRAIKYMLWAMRRQLFWDGNKRTSILSANKLLIAEGKGILTIKEEHLPEFNRRLSSYYETNDFSKIDSFIYEKCIYGIDYKK
jgi:Fic family protein